MEQNIWGETDFFLIRENYAWSIYLLLLENKKARKHLVIGFAWSFKNL